MEEMENKYLQKVDLKALQKETGKSLEELAKLAEIGPKVIYKWKYMHKDSSRPSYNAMVRLLEAGASVETLFGIEYKSGIKVVEKPLKITEQDIGDLFQYAADALKNKR